MPTDDVQRLLAFGRNVRDEVLSWHEKKLPDSTNEAPAALEAKTANLEAMNAEAERFIALVQTATLPDSSDLDAVEKQLAAARDALGQYFAQQAEKRKRALEDTAPHQADRVAHCYNPLLAALANLHNSFNALAWLLGEHVAEADELVPGKFGSKEDLLAALGG